MDYKFYISRYVDGSWEDGTDLESYFEGLHYLKCDGLSKYGEVKNIFTETYAETDELRVYIPPKVSRKNTDIEFEFVFEGENRRDTYHSFVDWLSGKRLKYWDTLRNRELEMILIESVEPEEDELYGSHPYILVPFTFKNLRGQTEKKV